MKKPPPINFWKVNFSAYERCDGFHKIFLLQACDKHDIVAQLLMTIILEIVIILICYLEVHKKPFCIILEIIFIVWE